MKFVQTVNLKMFNGLEAMMKCIVIIVMNIILIMDFTKGTNRIFRFMLKGDDNMLIECRECKELTDSKEIVIEINNGLFGAFLHAICKPCYEGEEQEN